MRKFVVLVLLLSLCISGAAFAQGTMPTFCGTLTPADCTILTNSQNAMKTLDSASFDLTINATVTNVPNMTAPMTFSLVGNGSYSGMSSLQNGVLNMQANPSQFYNNLLTNLDADLTLMLTLPPEALQAAGASFPNPITLQARFVDGVGYVNLDTLKAIINQPNLKGWYGLDLAGLLQGALQRDPTLFDGMAMMGSNTTDMTAMMQQFTDPTFLNQFITISRTDTGAGDAATFHVTVNFGALMSSSAMHDMMQRQMQAQGKSMTDAEIQQAMAMSAQMMQGMTLNLDEQIGLTDSFVRSIHGTFAFDSTSMMSAMATPSAASTTEAAPSVSVDFTLNYSNFNSAPAITAPANATLLPFQMLLGALPTPGPTQMIPTVLPTATATGTMEVTAAPTSESTSEPTAEPTSESTAAPTSESTAAATLPATLEPTAEVTAGA